MAKSRENLEAELKGWQRVYKAAEKRNDKAGMQEAHAKANEIRRQMGTAKSESQAEAELNGWGYVYNAAKRRDDTEGMAQAHSKANEIRAEQGWEYDPDSGKTKEKILGPIKRTVNSKTVMENAKIWDPKQVKPMKPTPTRTVTSPASSYLTGPRVTASASPAAASMQQKTGDDKLKELAQRVVPGNEDKWSPEGIAKGFGYGAERTLSGAAGALEDAARFVSGYGNKLLSGITSLGGLADNPVSDYLARTAENTLSNSFTDRWRTGIEERYQPDELSQKIGDIGEAAGAMLPTIAAGLASGGLSAGTAIGKGASMTAQAARAVEQLQRGIGLSAMLPSVMGSSTRQAMQEGADINEALAYGALSGALETGTESMFAGIPGIKSGIASDILRKATQNPIVNRVADTLGEGVEEVVSGILTPYLQRMTYNEQAELASNEDLMNQFVSGVLISGLMQGATGIAGRIAQPRERAGLDVSGLGENSRKNYQYLSSRAQNVPDFQRQWDYYNRFGSAGVPLEQVEGYPTRTPIGQTEAYAAHAAGMNDYRAQAVQDAQSIISGRPLQSSAIDRALNVDESRGMIEEAIGEKLPTSYSEARKIVREWQAGNVTSTNTEISTESTIRDAPNTSGLVQNDYTSSMNESTAKSIDNIAKKAGVTVEIADDVPAAGEYRDGVIRINANAENPVRQVFVHELTHHLEQSGDYQTLSDFVRAHYEADGVDFTAYLKDIQEEYAAHGVTLDEAGAMKEAVAEISESVLFTDERSIQKMAQQNRSLVQKIRDWLHEMRVKLTGTREEKFVLEAEKRYQKALDSLDGQKKSAPGGTQYKIEKASDGTSFVDVTEDILKGASIQEHTKILADLIQNKFGNQIEANGQTFGINQKTNNEWRRSKSANRLYQKNRTAYLDKIQSFQNADELMTASRDYVGEGLRHPRKDNFVEFARGKVDYKVGERGYEADVIVGIRKNGQADLYDIVNIQDKNIAEARILSDEDISATDPIDGASATSSIPASRQDGNLSGQNSLGTTFFDRLEKTGQKDVADRIRKRMRGKELNPFEFLRLTPEEVNTTPELEALDTSSERGGNSKFYGSTQSTSILDEHAKELIRNEDDVRYYQNISNQQTLEEANSRLNEGGAAETLRWANLDPEDATAQDIAEGFILMKRYQDAGDYDSMVTVVKKLRQMGTRAGQTVQAFSILGRMTPESMSVYAQKELDQAKRDMIRQMGDAWVDKRKKMFDLTAEEVKFIQQRMEVAYKLPEGRDKNIQLAQIAQLIQDKIPTSVGRMVKGFARNSMLLNPKTMLRNVVGNVIMMPANLIQDTIGAAVDMAAGKATGVRTSGRPELAGPSRAFARGAFESFDDFRRHINTRQMTGDRFEAGTGNDFRRYSRSDIKQAVPPKKLLYGLSNALNGLDRVTGFLLDAGDRPFFEMYFTHSLNRQMKLNKAAEPTADMIEIATNEAMQRTWQDDNGYTKFVTNLRNGLNFGKNYGLGSVLMPFAKTPANLTKALVEYSPAGVVRAITKDASDLVHAQKTGKGVPKTQKRFVDDLSKGITGTLVLMAGYWLAQAGIISGQKPEDDDEAAFLKNVMGIAPYSVRINGTSYSYDWAQPVGGLLAMGADFAKSMETDKNPDDKARILMKSAAKNILNAISTGGNVLFEQSFMQSVQELFQEEGLVQGLISAAAGAPSQFVPTALSQIAQITDPVARTSFVYGDIPQTAKNRALAKMPGKKETLAPVVDVLGNEVLGNGGNNAWYNVMLNPANQYPDTSTKAAREIYRVYSETGDTTVIPRIAPYYLEQKDDETGEKKKYIFTPIERAEYQKTAGKTNERLVDDALKFSGYQNLSNTDQAEVHKAFVSYANELAEAAYFKKHGIAHELSSKAVKIQEAEKAGVPAAQYLTAYVMQAGIERGLSYQKGKHQGDTIPDSKGLLIMQAVNGVEGLDDAKRKTLYESFGVGKKVVHYNPAKVEQALSKMKNQ